MIFWIGGNALAQSNPPKARPIDMKFNSVSKQDATWQFLANEASKVRVFMGGENHQEVDFNSLMEYGFMNRLHKYAGYRHYVIELSPARAHYLNRYIKYSDTHARDALKGVSSPKYMNLFENLHRWNQGLDEDERITVHGVDVVQFVQVPTVDLGQFMDAVHAPPLAQRGRHRKDAFVVGFTQLFLQFRAGDGAHFGQRFKTGQRGVDHANGFLKGFFKTTPNGHHFPDGLHGTPHLVGDAVEFGQIKPWDLHHAVVQRRFKTGRGIFGHHVFDAHQIHAQS